MSHVHSHVTCIIQQLLSVSVPAPSAWRSVDVPVCSFSFIMSNSNVETSPPLSYVPLNEHGTEPGVLFTCDGHLGQEGNCCYHPLSFGSCLLSPCELP